MHMSWENALIMALGLFLIGGGGLTTYRHAMHHSLKKKERLASVLVGLISFGVGYAVFLGLLYTPKLTGDVIALRLSLLEQSLRP
jgi:hypothetical protein